MACKLKGVPGSTDFAGPTGADVTLVTKDVVGEVLILKAKYGDDDLVPDGQAVRQVKFKIKAGVNTMEMVFTFSQGTAGKGELREDCPPDSQLLRVLRGSQPFQAFDIHGE
jgi:hypothetical protein